MIEKWLFILNVGYAGEIGLAKRVPFKDHLPKGGGGGSNLIAKQETSRDHEICFSES